MAKYTYEIEEYSQDSRHYEIVSDVKLSEEEITDIYCEVDFVDGYTNQWKIEDKGNVKVTFKGTEFGDDSQVNINGEIKEKD
tara:strand:- start:3130 stop:3375 length:246 start_codon:yes stop_codon:yes gene_type:complete